jgi:hypothetical protein
MHKLPRNLAATNHGQLQVRRGYTSTSAHPTAPIFFLIVHKKELATFLEREQAQARINSTVHTLTSMCWDK